MPRALCPALLVIASLASAADESVLVNDIRFAIGVGPQPQNSKAVITESPANPALIGRDDVTKFDPSPGLASTLGGVYGRLSPFGLLYGGELRYLNGEQSIRDINTQSNASIAAAAGDTLPEMSYSQFGGAGLIGLGMAASPSVHLELLAVAGLDWVTMESLANRSGPNLDAQKGSGMGYTLGARVGGFWTDPETKWQYGLEAEYLFTRSELTTSYNDVTLESTLYNRGVSLRAVLGHRF